MTASTEACNGRHHHIDMSHLSEESNIFLITCSGCDEVRAIYRARDIGVFHSTLDAEAALLCHIANNGNV